MNTNIHFGERIKYFLETNEISTNEAAKQLNYTVQSLYTIFDKVDVSTSVLKKVCKAFDLSMSYFLNEEFVVDTPNQSRTEFLSAERADAEKIIAVLKTEKISLERENEYIKGMVEWLKQREFNGTNSGTK